MKEMIDGFRTFILRGNVVDLAVAVVIGAAFTAVVNSLVKSLITPLIAAIFGEPDFSGIAFEINNSRFAIGDFINAVVSFLLIALVVYFLIVVPMNRLMDLRRSREPEGPVTRACPECLSTVPAAARRCAFCTAEIGVAAPTATSAESGTAGA
jgi:large conductance mechanosensitive channel